MIFFFELYATCIEFITVFYDFGFAFVLFCFTEFDFSQAKKGKKRTKKRARVFDELSLIGLEKKFFCLRKVFGEIGRRE